MKPIFNYDIVCFDVDSTLVTIEGVDVLAEQKGVGEEVKKLTELAMEGKVAMEDVFSRKIDILAPSFTELQALGETYCHHLTPGAEKVIKELKKLDIDVWLVSGGLYPALLPLAQRLQIPFTNIHANEVFFDRWGNYKGINQKCSLTFSDGKSQCARVIGRDKRVAFVGDSVTDLATKPVVTTFIGYGGVVARKKVKNEAEYFIKTKNLEPLLWLMV